jgi:hypothetical protein
LATAEAYPETWGPARFGDPCHECGLAWSFTADDAIAMVLGTADAYETAIGSADGSLAHPDLGWTVGGYVCHVADNLQIWAQWLAGAALADEVRVPGYEEAVLGEARFYTRVPLRGALWQLRQATRSWREAVVLARDRRVVLDHETRGPQSADDVVRSNAHDAFHHGWDIRRIVEHARDAGSVSSSNPTLPPRHPLDAGL